MTPRQNQFVAEYALSRNATQAAIKAGYSPRTARQTGFENLTKPDIRAAVAKYEAEAAERLAVTRERVLAELEAAIDVAREQRNPAAMIAGWREIAKICGYYAPERQRVEVSVDDWKLRTMFEAMTDTELLALTDGEQLGS
jgi:phage terminase small subunit